MQRFQLYVTLVSGLEPNISEHWIAIWASDLQIALAQISFHSPSHFATMEGQLATSAKISLFFFSFRIPEEERYSYH